MTLFFAQPYDIHASGFYFENFAQYETKAANLKNEYGDPVEEFEIQMIDGEEIDLQLFEAIGAQQANLQSFIDACEEWEDHQKINAILAVGECGYRFDFDKDDPDDFDVDLYEMDTLRDLAIHFVEEGYYGEIPEKLQYYIDYDAIARDLGMDYSETRIAGVNYVYRCL